ncbi:HupE/UreJ family protein [Phenylobacterium sp.]|uniref:HupE/UreJ family protein n=1 Tax=Phenylobacterium sp. TaxID=1871053 RepID=UPI003983131A
MPPLRSTPVLALAGLAWALMAGAALAHGVADKDAAFIQAHPGPQVLAFLYLGAKHMVTGYDHLAFLVGVVFFLHRLRQVALYVTLFSIGHSITLLAGVLLSLQADAFLVDALIGLSVVYKAFDNLDGFRTLAGRRPDPRAMVAGFGLIHGLGLATKLQALELSSDGLAVNLVSFNVGVELGQLLALSVILAAMTLWRRTVSFGRLAAAANVALMAVGFLLMGYQLAGYALGGAS